MKTSIGWVGYKYDSAFISFSKINIVTNKEVVAKEGAAFILSCRLEVPEMYEKFIRSHPVLSDTTRIGVFNKNGSWVKDIFTVLSLHKMADEKKFDLPVSPGLPKGEYILRFAIQSGYYNPTHNSDKIELVVE